MNLLVDIGNARIKWALQEGNDLKPGEPLLRAGKPFKDLARPAWKDLEAPQQVLVANVAGGDYEKSVRTWVKRRWKVTPQFLHATSEQLGVTNAYREPGRLGADRWACLLAVHRRYREQPAIIVDCGTAITIDAITASGRHLGGLIAPGLDMMTGALSSGAPGIEILDSENRDVALLGSSTEVAVAGGVMYTAVSLIDRVFADLQSELGRSTRRVITGGDAGRIMPLLGSQPQHRPDLVLEGLAACAAQNAGVAGKPVEKMQAVEAAVCDT